MEVLPRVDRVAKQLGVDYAPVVVGFTRSGGRSVPDTDGILVADSDAPMLREAYLAWAGEQTKKAALKRERELVARWGSIVRAALTRARLQEQHG